MKPEERKSRIDYLINKPGQSHETSKKLNVTIKALPKKNESEINSTIIETRQLHNYSYWNRCYPDLTPTLKTQKKKFQKSQLRHIRENRILKILLLKTQEKSILETPLTMLKLQNQMIKLIVKSKKLELIKKKTESKVDKLTT